MRMFLRKHFIRLDKKNAVLLSYSSIAFHLYLFIGNWEAFPKNNWQNLSNDVIVKNKIPR